MTELPLTTNPFALMLDPEAVLRAIEQSQRLPSLHSRICRPLDKPAAARTDDTAEFDRAVDRASGVE